MGSVCKAAGLATSEQVPGKRKKFLTIWKPAIRIHDVRHTFASHLVSSGECCTFHRHAAGGGHVVDLDSDRQPDDRSGDEERPEGGQEKTQYLAMYR